MSSQNVQLVRRWPEGQLPQGFSSPEVRSTFASLEEATAQAVADLRSGDPVAPVRIEDTEGNVLSDKSALEQAVANYQE